MTSNVASLQDSTISVTLLHPTIGAEISGVDLSKPLSSQSVDSIRALLIKHKVIFFRDQALTREQHIRLARHFGEPEIVDYSDKKADFPEISKVYAGPDKPPIGANCWHSDWTGSPTPSMGTILRALEIPEVGGDTLFADMGAAYRGLPDAIKERINKLTAIHSVGKYLAKYTVTEHEDERFKRGIASQEHPVVRTHPESGEKILYVNSMLTTGIKGFPSGEGEELLNFLCAQASVPEYQVRFRWRKHSIAFWDNRSTQHYASADYYPAVRLMEAVSIKGDAPF